MNTTQTLLELMNANNALSSFQPVAGFEITETRRKYALLNKVLSNGQRSACFLVDVNTSEVFHAEGYGKRGRRAGTVASLCLDYIRANAKLAAAKMEKVII